MALPPQQLSQQRFAEELDELDEKLQLLQTMYEKYFIGVDRRPPTKERKQISDRLRVMRGSLMKNTALRFRVHTLFAKLVSFERMWDRTLREIEEGTYKRDVFKAKLRTQQGPPAPPPPDAAATAPRPAPAAGSNGLSEDKLRKLYDTYLVARQRCGEATAGISYDAVAQKIRSQVPTLLQKHGAKSIEFKVVIKGGKAVLKAVPKV